MCDWVICGTIFIVLYVIEYYVVFFFNFHELVWKLLLKKSVYIFFKEIEMQKLFQLHVYTFL